MIKKINYFFQALIIYIFFIVGRILGINLSRKIFASLFSLIGPFFKSTKIVKKNLKIFSPQVSDERINSISKNMWNNYGMTFIEYIFLDYFYKQSSHIICEDSYLVKLLKKNRQIIFISGHFANFELMSMEITKRKIKLATIYRPLNNLFLNHFMEYLRKKYICKNQIKKGLNGVRNAIEYIQNNHNIALMVDQRVSEGERINFFGQPALTTTLPAQLALKYNMVIVPVFIERIDNKFKIKFQEEIDASNFQNKEKLTIKINEVLENMIISNPNQWIWTHDRWK